MSDQASNADRPGGKEMNDAQYYASEFTDAELDALADAGEFYLEESGFFHDTDSGRVEEFSNGGQHSTIRRLV